MTLRWNPDGKGKRSYPPHLLQFGRQKRVQFYKAYILCAWIGWALGLALVYWRTNLDPMTGDLRFVLFQALMMIALLSIALFGMLFA